MAEISEHLAAGHGGAGAVGDAGLGASDVASDRPAVGQEIRNRIPKKAALLRRAMAENALHHASLHRRLQKARRGDVVLTVTAPFMLPYAIAFAAWLRSANRR